MTADQKLIVARLLMAIEESNKPHSFTISLPPALGEFEREENQAKAIHERRHAELNAAINAARGLLA